jgi:hypothetical protein
VPPLLLLLLPLLLLLLLPLLLLPLLLPLLPLLLLLLLPLLLLLLLPLLLLLLPLLLLLLLPLLLLLLLLPGECYRPPQSWAKSIYNVQLWSQMPQVCALLCVCVPISAFDVAVLKAVDAVCNPSTACSCGARCRRCVMYDSSPMVCSAAKQICMLLCK